MTSLRSSSAWLSHDLAQALAAMCPPLEPGDVLRAADALADSTDPARVISRLLRLGPDLLAARGIVETLSALRDLAA
jgi:hypothetical protein